MMVPLSSPDRRPAEPAFGRELAAQVLAPGARRGAQVHHQVARLDQTQGFVDFLELVGRTRPVALLLGQLDIGVVDVVDATTPC